MTCITNILLNRLPLIGHYYWHALEPIGRLLQTREKYGDIFRLDYGYIPTVWLCDYDQINTYLKSDAVQHRSHHLVPGFVGIWYVHTQVLRYITQVAPSGQKTVAKVDSFNPKRNQQGCMKPVTLHFQMKPVVSKLGTAF